jgi:SAM-dependent methyltransferase
MTAGRDEGHLTMAVEKTVISRGKAKGDSYYNRVAQNYEAKRTQQSWWHVEQDAMQELLAELPRGLEVVDIPFGTGRFVPFYQDNGYRVAGLDASADMIAAAQTALGDRFEGLDVRVGPFGQYAVFARYRGVFGCEKDLARVCAGDKNLCDYSAWPPSP